MKVGILTYHRAENYGALLQAYALSSFLKKQGFEVGFVDYWPNYHEDYFRIFPRIRFKKGGFASKLICLYQTMVWGAIRYKRKQVMKSFMINYLGLPDKAKYSNDKDVCKEFDIVVYGSDQIWRQQNLPGKRGLDYWYFGSSNIEARKISYAGSMGPSCLSEEEKKSITKMLSNFEAISVRETSLRDFFDTLGLKTSVVVDPVFLLNKDEWLQLAQKYDNHHKVYNSYILFYNLLNTVESEHFVEELSRMYSLPIIEITKKYGIKYLGKRYFHTVSVIDFLSLIYNSDYVVSNSFHGVALSVIFEKQFYSVGMGNKSGRVESLLSTLNIGDRYCKNGIIPKEKIDYDSVNKIIVQYSNRSKDFLMRSLCNNMSWNG